MWLAVVMQHYSLAEAQYCFQNSSVRSTSIMDACLYTLVISCFLEDLGHLSLGRFVAGACEGATVAFRELC